MTEAGWTHQTPIEPGWYWWRNLQKKYATEQGPFVYMVRWYGKKLAIGNCDIEDSHYTRGEWLGPITPDSYQAGAVRIVKRAKALQLHGLRDTDTNEFLEGYEAACVDILAALTKGRA